MSKDSYEITILSYRINPSVQQWINGSKNCDYEDYLIEIKDEVLSLVSKINELNEYDGKWKMSETDIQPSYASTCVC